MRRVALPANGARGAPVVVSWHRGRVALVSGVAEILAARRRGNGDVACTIHVLGGATYRFAALI